MRDSFIFYKSFYDAVEKIPQQKYRGLLLESIIKLGLFSEEISEISEESSDFLQKNLEKLESFCEETEQKLSKNYAVLAIFLSIKPQIIANHVKYLNGRKGKQYGSLGGAPKGNSNAKKTTPKQPLMSNEVMSNEVMSNVFNEAGVEEKKSKEILNQVQNDEIAQQVRNDKAGKKEKIDPYINPIAEQFREEYRKVFGQKLYLQRDEKLKIVELNSDIPDFPATIPIALAKLKEIEFDLPNYTPNANWLLKGSNYSAVLNGTYDKRESEQERFIREMREKLETERMNE